MEPHVCSPPFVLVTSVERALGQLIAYASAFFFSSWSCCHVGAGLLAELRFAWKEGERDCDAGALLVFVSNRITLLLVCTHAVLGVAGSCFFTLLSGSSRTWTFIVRLEASLLSGAGVGEGRRGQESGRQMRQERPLRLGTVMGDGLC